MATNFEVEALSKINSRLDDIARGISFNKKRFIKVGDASGTLMIPITSIKLVRKSFKSTEWDYEVEYNQDGIGVTKHIDKYTFETLENYFCI
jgi:hypothetical protein